MSVRELAPIELTVFRISTRPCWRWYHSIAQSLNVYDGFLAEASSHCTWSALKSATAELDDANRASHWLLVDDEAESQRLKAEAQEAFDYCLDTWCLLDVRRAQQLPADDDHTPPLLTESMLIAKHASVLTPAARQAYEIRTTVKSRLRREVSVAGGRGRDGFCAKREVQTARGKQMNNAGMSIYHECDCWDLDQRGVIARIRDNKVGPPSGKFPSTDFLLPALFPIVHLYLSPVTLSSQNPRSTRLISLVTSPKPAASAVPIRESLLALAGKGETIASLKPGPSRVRARARITTTDSHDRRLFCQNPIPGKTVPRGWTCERIRQSPRGGDAFPSLLLGKEACLKGSFQ
ncbi:hypothetical protein FB45DRAFT_861119 [Roridomyces roridus]|uniref:Uncharacterized protein n=1 Tax=Roridomyces roridus TaxID=1738132 RepID=A0AAD7CH85_9AGAR|nr:hypothetical protein FB45DRAFT_861119 [Roridomyces roridus]